MALPVSAGNNLLISVEVTKAAVSATEMIFGNTDLTTPGFQLYTTSTGKLRISLRTTSTGQSVPGNTTIADSASRVISLYLDGDQGMAYVFIGSGVEITFPFPSGATSLTALQAFGLGAYNSTLQTTFAATFRGLHILRLGSNENVPAIVQRLASNISSPLTDGSIPQPLAKRVQAIEIGQSNEYTAAPNRFYTVFGIPANNGGLTANFQVREVEKIAKRRNLYVKPVNAAIGSSSLPISFCGLCKGAWTSGVFITGGDAVTNTGNLYQCDDVIGALNPTTVAPTGTTASFSTADGHTWKYLGAASGIDIANHVYRRGERGFDPKFQLQFYAQPALQKVSSFDETWVQIQIGQTDAGNSTVTRQIMLDAYKSIVDYALFYGVTRIYINATIYCGAAGIDAFYMSKIATARADAIAFYAGNPNVFAGADLRVELGTFPVVASSADFIPGVAQLEPTGYHGNDYVYELGAEARYQNKLALGHI
jgi:hypothetical protein